MKTSILPEWRFNAASRLAICLAAATVGLSSVQAQGHKTNTSTGLKAGTKVDTGKKNTADGAFALKKNKDGSYNTAVGSNALRKNTGSSNVAISNEALKRNTSGEFNVGIGDGALSFNETGDNNVALGLDAGAKTDGDDNILIDHQGVAGESGIIRIGTDGTHTDTYLAGKIHGDGSGLTNVTAATLTGQIFGNQIAPASITSTQLAPNLSLSGNTAVTGSLRVTKDDFGLMYQSADNGTVFGTFVGPDQVNVGTVTNDKLVLVANNGTGIAVLLPNGNFGIGTQTPTSKLDVRGDIKLGSSGQYQATAGPEKLRILRGEIQFAGTVGSGSGFSSSRPGTGVYTITFSAPFASEPAVTATAEDASGPQIVTFSALSSSSVTIRVWTLAGAPVNTDFSFHAIGPR